MPHSLLWGAPPPFDSKIMKIVDLLNSICYIREHIPCVIDELHISVLIIQNIGALIEVNVSQVCRALAKMYIYTIERY